MNSKENPWTLVGLQICTATMENGKKILKKLKLPYDAAIPLLGINLKEMKALI